MTDKTLALLTAELEERTQLIKDLVDWLCSDFNNILRWTPEQTLEAATLLESGPLPVFDVVAQGVTLKDLVDNLPKPVTSWVIDGITYAHQEGSWTKDGVLVTDTHLLHLLSFLEAQQNG